MTEAYVSSGVGPGFGADRDALNQARTEIESYASPGWASSPHSDRGALREVESYASLGSPAPVQVEALDSAGASDSFASVGKSAEAKSDIEALGAPSVESYATASNPRSGGNEMALGETTEGYAVAGARQGEGDFKRSLQEVDTTESYASSADRPVAQRAMGEAEAYLSTGFLGRSKDGDFELQAPRGAGHRGYPHVLISFVYDLDGTFFTRKLGYQPKDWLGDSGAFTQWTVGGDPIDLQAYGEWCLNYRKLNPEFHALSLDVIPGTRDSPKVSKREREKGIAESLKNGDDLRAAGVPIWEVYHLFEPLDFLDRLLERRQPGERIAFGGLAGQGGTPVKRAFCDTAFAHLRDRYGWADLPPIHGLGMAPTSTLGRRYPWRSMDSSSWIAAAMFGSRPSKLGGMAEEDSRTKARPVRLEYLVRALEAWLRTERMLGETWHRRGVRFQR